MRNNPQNLAPDEYLGQAVRPEDRCYVHFGYETMTRLGLNHIWYRIVWERDGSQTLIEDFRWHFSESPAWLTAD